MQNLRSVLRTEPNIKNPIWCMVNAIYCSFYARTFCVHRCCRCALFRLYRINWSIRIALIFVLSIRVNIWCSLVAVDRHPTEEGTSECVQIVCVVDY